MWCCCQFQIAKARASRGIGYYSRPEFCQLAESDAFTRSSCLGRAYLSR